MLTCCAAEVAPAPANPAAIHTPSPPPPATPHQVESLRYDRRGNLLATYNGGVSYWNFERREEEKQELALPYSGACICGDVTPGGWVPEGMQAGVGGTVGGSVGGGLRWQERGAPVCPPVPACIALRKVPSSVDYPHQPISTHPTRRPPADMDYIVAGCHDASVHIYHFTQKKRSRVELHVRSSPARLMRPAFGLRGWLPAACLPACCCQSAPPAVLSDHWAALRCAAAAPLWCAGDELRRVRLKGHLRGLQPQRGPHGVGRCACSYSLQCRAMLGVACCWLLLRYRV